MPKRRKNPPAPDFTFRCSACGRPQVPGTHECDACGGRVEAVPLRTIPPRDPRRGRPL